MLQNNTSNKLTSTPRLWLLLLWRSKQQSAAEWPLRAAAAAVPGAAAIWAGAAVPTGAAGADVSTATGAATAGAGAVSGAAAVPGAEQHHCDWAGHHGGVIHVSGVCLSPSAAAAATATGKASGNLFFSVIVENFH